MGPLKYLVGPIKIPSWNMKQSRFTKAWDGENQQPVDIRNLPKRRNGDGCNCFCVECKKPLRAYQGRERAWHFRHRAKPIVKVGQ